MWLPFPIFANARRPRVTNVVWDRRDETVRAFDLAVAAPPRRRDRPGPRARGHAHDDLRRRAAAVRRSPGLSIVARGATDPSRSRSSAPRSTLELDMFNRRFLVIAADARAATAFLDQRMMQALLHLPVRASIHVRERTLLLVLPPRRPAGEVLLLVQTAKVLARSVPTVTASLYPPRARGGTARGSVAPGSLVARTPPAPKPPTPADGYCRPMEPLIPIVLGLGVFLMAVLVYASYRSSQQRNQAFAAFAATARARLPRRGPVRDRRLGVRAVPARRRPGCRERAARRVAGHPHPRVRLLVLRAHHRRGRPFVEDLLALHLRGDADRGRVRAPRGRRRARVQPARRPAAVPGHPVRVRGVQPDVPGPVRRPRVRARVHRRSDDRVDARPGRGPGLRDHGRQAARRPPEDRRRRRCRDLCESVRAFAAAVPRVVFSLYPRSG